MGIWSLIVPGETINEVLNPSFEDNVTDDWSTISGTALVQSAAYSKYGHQCGIVRGAAGADTIISTATNYSLGNNETITVSAFVKRGSVAGSVGIYDQTNTTLRASVAVPTGADADWERVEVSWLNNTGGAVNVRVRLANTSQSAGTSIYMDGIQMEEQDAATTYCDGDQEGCEWLGPQHNSTAQRSEYSRAGGVIYNLADDYDVTVMGHTGAGMGVSAHNVDSQPLMPGGLFRGREIRPRVMTMEIRMKGADLEGLHTLRKDLINAIKPDLVKDDQAFILRYTGASSYKVAEIAVTYDTGLEFKAGDDFLDRITLRLIAYDPYWYEEGWAAAELTAYQNLASTAYALARFEGDWVQMTSGLNGNVRALAWDYDNNCLYVGGDFTTAGGSGANYVAKWDPFTNTWSALGSGLNARVRDMTVRQGVLYVVGDFTTAGGAGANYIANWDGSSWTAYGTGGNAAIYCITFDYEGKMYIAGNFTTIDGTAANRIAWTQNDGTTWQALGTGLNNICEDVATDSEGNVWCVGQFTSPGTRAAKWDGSAWSGLGSGFNGVVYTVDVGPDDNVYIGGGYTTVDGDSYNGPVMWDGNQFVHLDPEIGLTVYKLVFGEDGNLYAAGAFSWAGNVVVCHGVAIWNGSMWLPVNGDADNANLQTCYTILPVQRLKDVDLYVGFDRSGTAETAEITTVTNDGTARAYPILTIDNSSLQGAVIRNLTTGKELFFAYDRVTDEVVTVDLRPGRRSIESDINGDIWRALLQGSDLADFYLLPGDNKISTWFGSTGNVYLRWRNAHEGVDGVGA